MDTLFPIVVNQEDIPAVPGLSYIPNYLTHEHERRLASAIDRLPWDTQWQRRRQFYGGLYGKSGAAPPLPDWGHELADRLSKDRLTQERFDQMLVNEYLPGQGIALHRDYEPYGRTVASISLLSDYVMDFRESASGRKEQLLLERRSVLVLSDVARYDWQHGIAPRKRDSWHGMTLERGRRLSITFRTLKPKS